MGPLSSLWTTAARWTVPAGWRQGRGAWGGLVAGQIITAASQGVPQDWWPRSAHITMLGPVPAETVTCTTADLKSGSSLRVREVTLTDGSASTLTRATVVFGADRAPTGASEALPAPADPPPQENAPMVPLGPPVAPEFTSQLTFRPVLGLPYTGEAAGVTCGWIGMPSGGEDELTPAVIAALADAWWIAAIVGLGPADLADGPPPVATVDFSITFPQQPLAGQTVDERGLWHVGEVLGGRGGYLSEQRRLYDPHGRLLALNTQLVALGGRGTP